METASMAVRLTTMADEEDVEKEHPHAVETVSFPLDRMSVARFRETFPRARWSDALQAWTVPGIVSQDVV